jgi:DNA repair protein RecN (Recombination protein N)
MERKELVEFQFSELNKAELRIGEEKELTRELELLSSTKQRIETASTASEMLSGEREGVPTARDILQEALKSMEELAGADPSLENETSRLRDMVYLADELASSLRHYVQGVVDDPERRAFVEDRIRIIHQLKRKYRADEAGLVEMRDTLKKELDQVAFADDRLDELQKVRDSARDKYLESAQGLSKSRKTLAGRISKEVKSHLADLELPKAAFEVGLTRVDDESGYRPDGIDRVEILISTNPSQTPGPIKKVASGGELSRLLIALKTVLAVRDRVPVLVFDEAEVGIGGETAFKVGEKLSHLAETHQLILVSHLPQIASQAGAHWVIEKGVKKGDTQAEAREVEGQSRVEEISRMLGARGDKKSLEKLARSFLSGPKE